MNPHSPVRPTHEFSHQNEVQNFETSNIERNEQIEGYEEEKNENL